MIRALILDLDDTLLDHTGAVVTAFSPLANELGADVSELAQRWASLEREIPAAPDRESLDQTRRRRLAALAASYDQSWSDEEADQRYEDYLRRYRSSWRLFDDVAVSLTKVRSSGVTVGVLTNGAVALQGAKVRATALEQYVEFVLTSESLGFAKPDARAFRAACERAGQVPHEVLYIGDRIDTDVEAARNAGLQAALISRTGGHERALEETLMREQLI